MIFVGLADNLNWAMIFVMLIDNLIFMPTMSTFHIFLVFLFWHDLHFLIFYSSFRVANLSQYIIVRTIRLGMFHCCLRTRRQTKAADAYAVDSCDERHCEELNAHQLSLTINLL